MIILNSWLVALFAGTFVMKDFSVKLHVHSDERALDFCLQTKILTENIKDAENSCQEHLNVDIKSVIVQTA